MLAAPGSFAPPLYQAFATCFVYCPAEMLALMAGYVKANGERGVCFWNSIRMYMGLWFLFYDSALSVPYLDILGYLVADADDFWAENSAELAGIAVRFATSAEPFGVLAGSLFRALFCPELLAIASQSAALLVQTRSPHIPRIVVRARQVFPSVELVRSLAKSAAANSATAWAALLKYARMGSEHAASLLSVAGWLGAGGDNCLRVTLAVFVHPQLRDRLARMGEFPAFLLGLCSGKRADLLRHVCSLVQRIKLDGDLLAAIDRAGFFAAYFEATLAGTDVQVMKFGIIIADLCGRVGFLERWVEAVAQLIRLFETRYDELGDDLICVLSTLSIYPETMAVMRAYGLVKYYANLVTYESYRQHATFFMNNAARF
jgi:hypothetical protein